MMLLVACKTDMRKIGKIFPGRPDREFAKVLANASPDFRQGWEDGCTVGMSGGSNSFYKMFYQNNAIDGFKTMDSPVYSEAWSNGMWYCYRYDQIKNGADGPTIWGSMFGGYR